MPLGRIYTGGSTAKVARPVVHGFDLASMNDNHHREFKLKLGKVQAMAISGDTSGALQEAAQAEKALALRMDVMKEVIHEEEVKMTARAGTPSVSGNRKTGDELGIKNNPQYAALKHEA